MSDEELRRLERAWRESGDPAQSVAWLAARQRSGELEPERLELLAYLGYEPARELLQVPDAAALPSALFARGARPVLESVAASELLFLEGPRRVLLRWDPADDDLGAALRDLHAFGAAVAVVDLSRVEALGMSPAWDLVRCAEALTWRGGRVLVLGATQLTRRTFGWIEAPTTCVIFSDDEERALRSPLLELAPGAVRRVDLDWLLGLARWGRRTFARGAWECARGEQTGDAQRQRQVMAWTAARLGIDRPPQPDLPAPELEQLRRAGWAGLAAASLCGRSRCAWTPAPYRLPIPRAEVAARLIEWALVSA